MTYTSSYLRTDPTPPPSKKKRGRKTGYVAAALAISLVSGAAGGGVTYTLMNQQQPVSAVVSDEAEVSQVESGPLVTPAVSEPADAEAGAPVAASAGSGTSDISSIVSKVSDSVVEINTVVTSVNPFFGQYDSSGSGSGVIVSADGYIVTNDHVIDGASQITVRTTDGTEHEAKLIGTDSRTDLALIKIETEGLSAVSFADSDTIEVGELAVAIGNPLGTLGGTVTNGIISAKNREVTIDGKTMSLLQTSAAVNPGNSGGGLFNGNGELIGIVNAKSSGSQIEGLGFAIPSNTVQSVIGDLMDKGYVTGRPEFGITIREFPTVQAARYYGVDAPGVYVESVTRQNGFQENDRIISLNGQEIESSDQVRELLKECQVGDELDAVVWRDGGPQSITVSVGEQVPDEIREQIAASSDV